MTLGTLLYAIVFHNISLERSTVTKDPFTAEVTMLVTFLNRDYIFVYFTKKDPIVNTGNAR